MTSWRRFRGYVSDDYSEDKTHVVTLYKVVDPSWSRPKGLKRLIVPGGNLEQIASVNFLEAAKAFRNGVDALISTEAKPFLELLMETRGRCIHYSFLLKRPIGILGSHLVEYHILEQVLDQQKKLIGRQAFRGNQIPSGSSVILNPTAFEHIRYTKE